jgi:hypothetical protein
MTVASTECQEHAIYCAGLSFNPLNSKQSGFFFCHHYHFLRRKLRLTQVNSLLKPALVVRVRVRMWPGLLASCVLFPPCLLCPWAFPLSFSPISFGWRAPTCHCAGDTLPPSVLLQCPLCSSWITPKDSLPFRFFSGLTPKRSPCQPLPDPCQVLGIPCLQATLVLNIFISILLHYWQLTVFLWFYLLLFCLPS